MASSTHNVNPSDDTTLPTGVVVVGEVLFDCFEQRKVLGGAPFNVAWNLTGFGLKPLFVSAVGQDDNGKSVEEAMHAWGMPTHALQQDGTHPTGTVQVSLKDGKPSYTIVPDQAYDFLCAPTPIQHTPQSILYHGSLALRSEVSRKSVMSLKAQWSGQCFVDINIREPWIDYSRVGELIENIDWLKVSDEEVEPLLGEPFNSAEVEAQLRALKDRYSIGNIILTCGGDGAYLLDNDLKLHVSPAVSDITIQDTVGAGDAFASVCLLGISKGWEAHTMLEQAGRFAAKVCGMNGATRNDRSFYAI